MPSQRSSLRDEYERLDGERNELETRIVAIEQRLHALASRDPVGDEANKLREELHGLEAALRQARDRREKLAAEIELEESRPPATDETGAQAGENEPGKEEPKPGDSDDRTWDLTELIDALERDLPILLLPVRIETRFWQVDAKDDTWELLLRIYPDELHVDTHERRLSPVEIEWGQHFWTQVWTWGNDPQRTEAAWSQLVKRLGGPRASWVTRTLKPEAIKPEWLTAPFPKSFRKKAPPPFPDVERRATSWTRAARAGMLPDVWVAWGFGDGQPSLSVTSRPVRRDLAVGPDPAAIHEPGEGELPIDRGMKWMVDFEEALRAGMAMRVYVGKRPHYDVLMVFGLRSGRPRELSRELERHLSALRFGRGLDFVRQGTPTNNTDATRSGWDLSEDDDGSFDAFVRELGPLPEEKSGDNAQVLSGAFWIGQDVVARLRRGRETEQLDAAMMNQLLWATTWDYYLREMIGTRVIPYGQLRDWTYEHWVKYVRGRGPIPALRAGDQPYGVLPVLVGEVGDPRIGHPEDPLEIILRTAREVWDASAPNVTRLRLASSDADRELVQALATLPHPERYAVRGVLDRRTLGQVWPPPTWDGVGFDLTGPGSLIRRVLAGFGLGGRPLLLDTVYSDGSSEWVGPLVSSQALSATEPLGSAESGTTATQPRNFLAWMAHSAVGTLAAESHPYEKDSLLYVLARRAGMLEDQGGNPARWRRAAAHLAARPSVTLDQLLRETLGLCAYRLDAWETSLATRQLAAMRERVAQSTQSEGGIQVGGFGWVEGLTVDPPPREVFVPSAPPDEKGAADGPESETETDGQRDESPGEGEEPDQDETGDGSLDRAILIDPANKGYVHAPSLQHATTAAVLRSAWTSHGGVAGTPMAVDLSSARARDASQLIEGVRKGLGLGELLGYRFERHLHEAHPGIELDKYIDGFRELAPLVANKQFGTESTDGGVREIAAPSVVDGLRLLRMWQTNDATLLDFLDEQFPGQGAERSAIEEELQGLADAVDSLADGSLAEGVHQVLQGNQARAGATMDSVTTGELPPPELEVTSPARSGRGVTYRVLVPLSDTPPLPSSWPGAGMSARARAEPELEAWVASLFPSPAKIIASARYFTRDALESEDDPTPVGSRDFSMGELGLAALDTLLLAPDKPESAEFGQRLFWLLKRNRPAGVPDGCSITIDAEWSEGLIDDEVALADFLVLARKLRRAVAEARPLRAPDLALPTDGAGPGVDLDELFQRGNDFVIELQQATESLETLDVDQPVADLVEPLRAALLVLSNLGLPGAFPRNAEGDDETTADALRTQRDAVLARAKAALTRAGDEATAAVSYDPETGEGESFLVERLKAVLGKGFPVLPRFRVENHPALETTFQDTVALQGGDVHAASAWLERAAKVQPRCQSFLRAIQLSEALVDQSKLALDVGQLPYRAGETWAALPSDPGNGSREGHVSLIAQRFGDWQWDGVLRGFVIDEFSEVIPRAEQTTGIAFHYDAPGARAPQSMLLLGLIDAEPEWTAELIQDAMWATFQAMKRRLADSNALVDGGHFLPAVYLEAPNASGRLAGDLARGMVDPEEGSIAEHERPELDLELKPLKPGRPGPGTGGAS